MRIIIVITLVTTLSAALSDAAMSSDVDALIQRVWDKTQNTSQDVLMTQKMVSSKKTDTVKDWIEDFTDYRHQRSNLSQERQISEWLALYDRIWTIQVLDRNSTHRGDPSRSYDYTSMEGIYNTPLLLIREIPSPEYWHQLHEICQQREKKNKNLQNAYLLYMTGVLQQDPISIGESLDAIRSYTTDVIDESAPSVEDHLETIEKNLRKILGDTEELLQIYVDEMMTKGDRDYWVQTELPDIVGIVGEKRAKPMIQELLRKCDHLLDINSRNPTRPFVIKSCLEMIDELKVPQWKLACGFDALELYEQLEAKYPASNNIFNDVKDIQPVPLGRSSRGFTSHMSFHNVSEGDFYHQQASIYYFLNLILHDRNDEALSFIQTHSLEAYWGELRIWDTAWDGIEAEKIELFLRNILDKNPQHRLWQYYIPIATQLGKTDELTTLLQKKIAELQNEGINVFVLYFDLFKAHWRRGAFDEALNVLKNIDQFVHQEMSLADLNDATRDLVNLGGILARSGYLLEREDWIERGVGYLYKAVILDQEAKYSWGTPQYALVQVLIKLGRYSEAQKILMDTIVQESPDDVSKSHRHMSFLDLPLGDLVYLYHEAKRYKDILSLLEKFPYWRSSNILDIFKNFSNNRNDFPLSIAEAFYHTGHTTHAEIILKNILLHDPDKDAAYALLVAINPQDLIPWLDKLYQKDVFEERPLIWKAQVLTDRGQWTEAEKVAKQAMSLDPSDGDQGQGDRMRVYDIMARIQKAQGYEKDSRFYQSVVDAIDMSEEADEYFHAGLLSEAITRYQKALRVFDDAYCVQSRLALRLHRQGKTREAAAHYRKAFALMPSSFGRLESHCFGCEGIFNSMESQTIAKEVFTEFQQAHAQNPQVYYLLGYLAYEQGLFRESLSHFKRATTLDPDYINAWKKQDQIKEYLYLNFEERQEITRNLLRLDPYLRHVYLQHENVWDLKTLWQNYEHKASLRFQIAGELPILKAAHDRLSALENPSHESKEPENLFHYWQHQDWSAPRNLLNQHHLIAPWIQMFRTLRQN